MATDQHSYTGPRPLAEATARAVANARLRRKVRQLYDRPPRLLVEVIFALAKVHGDMQEAEHIIDSHLHIPDEVLEAIGCRDVQPAPIHIVSDRNGQAG